jgi:soluble P-type ATPase
VVEINVPGLPPLQIEHLVLDYNGTMAVDGKLLPGLKQRLGRLARKLHLHVLTADTFGKVHGELRGAHAELVILGGRNQDLAKAAYVRKIGARRTACIGNGRNDRLMLRAAALGIALVQAEGAAAVALAEADVVARDARDALDLFLRPLRLVATLRN